MISSVAQPQPAVRPEIVYPESDGQPMADNTKQARWIVILYGNLSALYRSAQDVFVAADLFWYPVEGDDHAKTAPDVMVVLGRPKGDRGSYKQWEENNVPPAVVFEVLSPSNFVEEMADKLAFYDEYGVEEYYVYNPQKNTLLVYVRGRMALRLIHHQGQHTSARLGIRFDLSGPEMAVFYPDGQRFLTFEELKEEQEREQQLRLAAEQRADQAQQRADQAQQQAKQAQQRAARLAELSRKARRGQASAEEIEELDRLEEQADNPGP
jgi:Uma2 family endonuclease